MGYPGRRAARSRHRCGRQPAWIPQKYAVVSSIRAARPGTHWQAGWNGLGDYSANALQARHRAHPPRSGLALRPSGPHRSWAMPTYGRCQQAADLPHWPCPAIRCRLGLAIRSAASAWCSSPGLAADLRKAAGGLRGADQSATMLCASASSVGAARSKIGLRARQIRPTAQAVRHARKPDWLAAGSSPCSVQSSAGSP